MDYGQYIFTSTTVLCTDPKRRPYQPSAVGQEGDEEAVAESHPPLESSGEDAQDVHQLGDRRILSDHELFLFAATASPTDLGLPRGRRVVIAGLRPQEPEGHLCSAAVFQRPGMRNSRCR